ncbi:MAG TPA: NADH-quinone oxidoreductase subunit M [Holophagaceae bacterium]|nr:NADH-quinone oxidoreductase subunit M [Holophagaceae bacterium]
MTTWMSTHLLSFLVFSPGAAGLALLAFPERQARLAKLLGLLVAIALFGVSLRALSLTPDASGWLFLEHRPWFSVAGLPVDYRLGLDGLNLWLALLTALLVPVTMLATWSSLAKREGTFAGLLLLLETGVLGALLSQDMLFFYLFWEGMLIPTTFMIWIWGGEDRRYAGTKYFLYLASGSLLWLVGLLYLAGQAGSFSPELMAQAAAGLSLHAQGWLFLAFVLAFAIKFPIFPVHTWMPDAYSQAPVAAVPVGMLVKLGGYGFLRFVIPILPAAAARHSHVLAVLAVVAILFGSLVALVQRDMKKLVAYSSLAHMGFVLLGLASLSVIGVQGALLQLVNLGVSTTALFLMIGMLERRAGTTMIADFGGVASRMPVLTGFWLLAAMASIGLPLTNGFVGEFLILNGTFTSGFAWGRVAACLATLGVLLGAAYLLWMTKRVFWGAENADPDGGTAKLAQDLTARELAALLPLAALILWIGVHPRTFLAPSDRPVAQLLSDAQAPAPAAPALGTAAGSAPLSEVHE